MTKILATIGIVLLTTSVASAACGYTTVVPVAYGPTPVVVNYAPAGPVYPYTVAYPYTTAYPYTVYSYPTPYMVARPVVAAPVVYGPATVVYPVPRYARPWVYVPGQPVRNALRATFR